MAGLVRILCTVYCADSRYRQVRNRVDSSIFFSFSFFRQVPILSVVFSTPSETYTSRYRTFENNKNRVTGEESCLFPSSAHCTQNNRYIDHFWLKSLENRFGQNQLFRLRFQRIIVLFVRVSDRLYSFNRRSLKKCPSGWQTCCNPIFRGGDRDR